VPTRTRQQTLSKIGSYSKLYRIYVGSTVPKMNWSE